MKPGFEKRTVFEQAHILPRKYKNLQNLPHWHREHELLFVEQGSATVMVNGSFFTLTRGEAAFLQGEETHSIQAQEGAVLIVAKLDATYFQRLVGTKRLASPILKGTYEMETFFVELFEEMKLADAYSGMIADSSATRLLARMLRQEPSEQVRISQSSTVQNYKRLLELISHSYADMTFDEAASFMHFSKPYFSKFFFERSGMTFTHYLNTVRISAAVEKLLAGNATVTEISQSCGFNTIRNFNRVFKELTGYTPNTLPQGYSFMYAVKEYADSGFNPTLRCTKLLEN